LTAAAAIARNPVNNVTALFNLTSKTPAFTPTLPGAPNDWTVALNYAGGGLSGPDALAIDAAGTVWVTNVNSNSVTKIGAAGIFLTGSTGITGDGLNGLGGIAIDAFGNAWITNSGNSPTTGSVSEISGNGPFPPNVSGCTGAVFCVYTGGGLMTPVSIAVDGFASTWVANLSFASITRINALGGFVSPSSGCPGTTDCGYTGGGLNFPAQIGLDGFGNAWITNSGNNSLTEFSFAGGLISPNSGCPGTTNCGYTGGGLNLPQGIAVDPNNNAWIANNGASSLTEISSAGVFLSPTSGCPKTTNCGYRGGGLNQPRSVAIDSSGNVFVANGVNSVTELNSAAKFLSGNNGFKGGGLNLPSDIAIDASGNVWLNNESGNSLTEFVGLAAPVMTPSSACLQLHNGRPVCLP
jgi:streptogramin lyase